MSVKHITQANLRALVEDLLSAGTRVAAPARAKAASPIEPLPAKGQGAQASAVDYRWLQDADELAYNAALPRRSLKEFFLPTTEELLHFKQHKGDVELQAAPSTFGPRVVLGARPCDVAGLPVVDAVMGWDYRDDFWFGRRAATTVIALACPGVDRSCFCTALGLGPDFSKGADLLLVPAGDGFRVETATPAGEQFVANNGARFAEASAAVEPQATAFRQAARHKVATNLELAPAAMKSWLEANFEHPYWNTIGLRCHGCGACAAVCPTCHCFDIVDETEGLGKGTRRRNWDTCQTALFTVHGSGHNPRAQQNARFRQRVMHKFAIYPRKFQEILCTGCGRCARACPGGMDLLDILSDINRLAATAGVTAKV